MEGVILRWVGSDLGPAGSRIAPRGDRRYGLDATANRTTAGRRKR
jgi:hypothetical protein